MSLQAILGYGYVDTGKCSREDTEYRAEETFEIGLLCWISSDSENSEQGLVGTIWNGCPICESRRGERKRVKSTICRVLHGFSQYDCQTASRNLTYGRVGVARLEGLYKQLP